jgi:hypothetical protein
MITENSFYAGAIRYQAARLVLADWWEEQGDPRAEAIRDCPEWPMGVIEGERIGAVGDGGGSCGDGGLIGGAGPGMVPGHGGGGYDGDGYDLALGVGSGHGGCGHGGDDGNSDISDGGHGDGGNGAGDGYDGCGDGAGADGKPHLKEIDMPADGWYVTSVASGYYPYVRVALCEFDGFEVTMRHCRVIRRFGQGIALSTLAAKGPAEDTHLLPEAAVEYEFRPNFRRLIPTDGKFWRNVSNRRAR